jgi:hypothetical protein
MHEETLADTSHPYDEGRMSLFIVIEQIRKCLLLIWAQK